MILEYSKFITMQNALVYNIGLVACVLDYCSELNPHWYFYIWGFVLNDVEVSGYLEDALF